MANSTKTQVIGLSGLSDAFKQLVTEVQEKVAKQAVGHGARLMKESVVKQAMMGDPGPLAEKAYRHGEKIFQPGSIAKAVHTVRKTEKVGQEIFIIGVKSNKANGYMGRIASFNEFGTVKMVKQPFMTPAFETTKKASLDAITGTLRTGIETAARRARKGKR